MSKNHEPESQTQTETELRFRVTTEAMRPVNPDAVCFYCEAPVGTFHDNHTCALVNKTIKIRMIVEYDVNVPFNWTEDQILFYRHHSAWCSDNAIDELNQLITDGDCLCPITRFEYVGDVSGPFLEER